MLKSILIVIKIKLRFNFLDDFEEKGVVVLWFLLFKGNDIKICMENG